MCLIVNGLDEAYEMPCHGSVVLVEPGLALMVPPDAPAYLTRPLGVIGYDADGTPYLTDLPQGDAPCDPT